MFQSDLLKNRVALITGGGTGICRGIALAFTRHGCDVAITSRKLEHLEPTVAELKALGVRAVAKVAGRMGTVDDIANASRYLASEAASYVNGVTLVVDGGLWLRSARMRGEE